MSNLAIDAMLFAREIHANQVRKYTGNPYFDHLAEVAGIASTAACPQWHSQRHIFHAVCWLHDCVEDQGVTKKILIEKFGRSVADGVMMLSDLEEGNRAERKAASRARLAVAPGWIQTIKCADLISNTSSIVKHDPKFAETYLQEKRDLLAAMHFADPYLHKLAMEIAGEPAEIGDQA